ncbi:MAG TPA: hypothetical protein VNM89_02455 [Solirubrobacterales bacterium]|nr:hypothetical protein [Solirubrobacterales bacterium]
MSESLVIPAEFNGPMDSGNGGYSAGAVAAFLDGAAAVSLRSPVPLDTHLDVVVEDGVARALDGETLVAEAERAPGFGVEVPDPVGLEEAREASTRYRGLMDGPFSRCFVCGRAREDALEVFAGPVAGREVVASSWTPPAWTGGDDARVRPEIVWAVLDCPTYFAAYAGEEGTIAFLARLTARLDALVSVGEEHVVMAWPIDADGRKRRAGSAVISAEGEVLAAAEALLIEPRQVAA